MKPDTCHCCEPPPGGNPVTIDNRPGLSAVTYRVGTFANFRQAMFQAISHSAALQKLSTRQSDDYAITLLELWAAVADVLTFYQERIANEAFLRTARWRESVLRMARMIGYELAPGSAATTYLSFTAEKDKQVDVSVGLRVQSVPEQDEKCQKYETLEKLTVYDWLNEQPVFPAPSGINPLAKGSMSAYLAPGVQGLNIAENLVDEDRVLLFDPAVLEPVEELIVKALETDHEHIKIQWAAPVQGANWNMTTRGAKRVRSLRLFGYDAPSSYPKPNLSAGVIRTWTVQNIGTGSPGADNFAVSAGSELYLDSRYDDLKVGTRLLLVDGTNQQAALTVTAVGQDDQTLGSVTDTVTRITVTPEFSQIDDRRQVIIYELSEPELSFWGFQYPDIIDSAFVYVPGRRIDAQTIEIARPIEKSEYQAGNTVKLTDIEAGRQVLLKDASGEPIAAKINQVEITGNEIVFGATSDDAETLTLLALGQEKAKTAQALCSAALDPFPTLASPNPTLGVTIGSIGPRTITLSGSPGSLNNAAGLLQAALRNADTDPVFAEATVLGLDHRLIVLPGDFETDIKFSKTAGDETTIVELGLTADPAQNISGLLSGTLEPVPAYTRLLPQLSVDIGPVSLSRLDLDYTAATLDAIAADLESKLNAAEVAPFYKYARVRVIDKQLIVFPGMIGPAHQDFLKIDLRLDGSMSLERGSTVLMGNVARASHGEAVVSDLLGDADPTVPFQEFTLKKSPITFVPSAGHGGVDNTLQLFVNDVLWKQVDSLYGLGATDMVYTAHINDEAEMSVRFGDGVTGARPPKGRANVVARYRRGIGLEGRVKAGQLKTLLDKPKGLKAVINPAGADGGADPETLEKARQNAPATVRTFDRAVSLLDLEDLARSRSEVAKAKVTWVWSGCARAAHLTVAGQNGANFSAAALALIHAGLTSARDPNRLLLLDNYEAIPIVITATLNVEAGHVASKVALAANSALLEALSFQTLDFAQTIHLSDVYAVLQEVAGVVSVDIDQLMFKQIAEVSDTEFDDFLDNRGIRRLADGTPKPVQNHLWILAARPNRLSSDPAVLPAEQAFVESPSQDVTIITKGGLPDWG